MKGETFKPWIRPTATLDGGATPMPGENPEWHKQYDNVDGTGEMLMGLMLLAFGLLNYLQQILPKDSVWRSNGFMGLLFMYGVLAVVLVPGYLFRSFIKKRITFPRTGYVASQLTWKQMFASHAAQASAAPGVPTRKGMLLVTFIFGLSAAIVAAGVALFVAFQQRHPGTMSPLSTVGFVLYLAMWPILYAFFFSRIGRGYPWKWLVALCMTAGLVVIGVLRHDGISDASRPVMLFIGGLWLLSGVVTLISYLLHTNPPVPEAE